MIRTCRPSSGSLLAEDTHGAPLRAGPDTAPDSKAPEYSQSKRSRSRAGPFCPAADLAQMD
jgi:hypothetical protein